MDNDVLHLLNKATLKLLSTQTLESLCGVIVEDGKKLIKAQHGGLFLMRRNKLEKTYISSNILSNITPRKKGGLLKTSESKNITTLDRREIQKFYPKIETGDIEWFIRIPLPQKTGITGILILETTQKPGLSESDRHVLSLYASIASLAITKIQHNEETQRAVELRDRFISLASHELRTPLTSLNGYIHLLYNKLANKKTPEARWVHELYHECNRLTTLVKDLLDINRINQGQLAFVFNEVSMIEVITKAIDKLRYLENDRSIIFEKKTPNNGYIVVGDQEKLLEMVSALLGNALKFSKTNTKVQINLSSYKSFIRMKVIDEGKGIPKQDIDSIFEGFYKTKHSREKEGMGVGLLLAKHVITFHRGKIAIDSNENRGTAVTVDLPSVK